MGDITVNKRAYFDYDILQTIEAGIELLGLETKAVKTGRIDCAGSFVILRNNEAWLVGATIPPYQTKNTPFSYDPQRSRRLLLHSREIKELIGSSQQKGLTIVPLKVYTKGLRVKILIGLARHKKKSDKRETIKRREAEREIDRAKKLGT